MNYENEPTTPGTRRDDEQHDKQGESCGTSSSQPSKSTSSGERTSGSSGERQDTSRQAPGADRSGSGDTRQASSTGNKPKTNEGKTGVSGESDDES